ncbi:MOSC domain-containing protein [Anaerobacillus sp. HL2]|nr:MOSC domain-containing protein [Anaerobacillus sp. HL2]
MEHNGNEFKTGIIKTQVSEPVYLGKLNIQGDEQADLIHHGGEDKVVCVYPYDITFIKNLESKLNFGAFGENLTVTGLTEENLFIGDILEIGSSCPVSQPRQPLLQTFCHP